MKPVRTDELARKAGRLAGRWLPVARKVVSNAARHGSGQFTSRVVNEWTPAAKHSGAFLKHVVPAAVKPLHSLWHDILAFVFLVFAGIAAWKVWRSPEPMPPVQLALVVAFIVVMVAYGLASLRKSRRISRS